MIARQAASQQGVVTRAALLSDGLTRDMIDRRVASGHLDADHRGVYAVGHAAITAAARRVAALLACGPGGALSSFTAAVLWDLLPDGGAVHVATAGPHRAGRRV